MKAALAHRIAWIPRASVIAFGVLYVVAAALYPGGTRADPHRVGFSLRDNYWCDVLDDVTYGGVPNPAARIALGATILLALGVSALWWTVPRLYPTARIRGWLVRVAGLVSGAVTPWIATKHHDFVINVAALSGAFAFVVTMSAIGAREGKPLVALGAGALAVALLNYVCWGTGFALGALPSIQKAAFLFFLGWVFTIAGHVRRAGEARA